MLWAGQAVWTDCSSKQRCVCKQHPKDVGLNTASHDTPRNKKKTLGRGDTTISDIPQRSHPWKHLEKSFYCFNISVGRDPGSKDSPKPPGKWQMAAQMQRPSEDPGKSTYTKVQSLNIRWHWQVSSNRDDQHHPSHHQNKNWLQQSQQWSHVPSGHRGCIETYSSQDSMLVLYPSVAAGVAQHVTPQASTAQTTCPCRRLTKIRNPLIFLRLVDVFQQQWNSIACFATCSSFSTIFSAVHSQKRNYSQKETCTGTSCWRFTEQSLNNSSPEESK